jgi:hypothetical protein
MVVVDLQPAIARVQEQRPPLIQRVVDRFAELALRQRESLLLAEVFLQSLQHRQAPLLTCRQPLLVAPTANLIFDVVQLGDQAEHVMHLAPLIMPCVEEFPAHMGPAANGNDLAR